MDKLFLSLAVDRLRNETHFEFNESFSAIVGKYSPASLNIGELYEVYLQKFADETAALDVIRKSELTEEIIEQDHVRDKLYRGFVDAVHSALNHFNADKRQAARRIEIVLERYGNIAAKTLDDETAAIVDLLSELAANHAADVSLLALGEWIEQIAATNNTLKALIQERLSESLQLPTVKMKDARRQVDLAFRAILNRIEALVTVNGPAAYSAFITEVNAAIERRRNILASETGHRKSQKKE